ncbi:hypothetical protein RhiirA4_476262 [Rhizophagus irregularis]|uniref:Uncharacterized protein n=1 Tax=Rhizophagus irregularis TaxID=588596 RepID=A0A2I1HBB4_9GLOM|nr:hypothetical protein RhiirA4_476262 [Rhizophagus irregularis]
MFDSRLTYREIKDRFRWQACKKVEESASDDDSLVIKDCLKRYNAFFGKIVRINGMRSSGVSMGWKQSEPLSSPALLRQRKQKRTDRFEERSGIDS